jgi:hypothetical protein
MHPVALPDAGTLDFPIPIGGITGAIAQVTVRLSLLHRQTAALNVSLIGPDGTEVDLSSGNGSGASFGGLICLLQPGGCFPSYTTFDDGGAVPITAGVNPFTGAVHRPEQPLSAFGGKSGAAANGIWRLRVRDSFVGGIGSLVRVEHSVREGAPVATADGYATNFQTSLTVTAPGLLGNDDAQGSEFEARLVLPPAHGMLSLADDGAFVYTRAAGFVGVDAFTYRPMSREARHRLVLRRRGRAEPDIQRGGATGRLCHQHRRGERLRRQRRDAAGDHRRALSCNRDSHDDISPWCVFRNGGRICDAAKCNRDSPSYKSTRISRVHCALSSRPLAISASRSALVGCTLPLASMARDTSVCVPGARLSVPHDHSAQPYLARRASRVAGCHSPPSTCTSTFAIGACPPQAGPATRYVHWPSWRRRVTRATSDFRRFREIEVSIHIGPSGVWIDRRLR